ncbi:hypothetical protein BGV72_24410 [Burkholderia ubonensis]|uniref:hypothetical protein n=1 Tax=Burkholderia ubonensis TaxID=101571 RepID=UPI0008FD97FB|nr:hypothetical protein [Burkholderia ubonensis]OJA74500.1 hypothetical protein BGV72_24410 [Burkholderia ubonensis]
MTKAHDPIADLIIDGLGGTKSVAELCQCTDSAVSQWRHDGVPRARLSFLRLARPDFDWPQIPADYPKRESATEISDRVQSSDDTQPPAGTLDGEEGF